ncbi:CNH domain-containing protein [Halteromyces radiatus]|uniref:CNH domain-containing protein n=1 Tax=Halteromyces radiatus TaxID=101107 RepID=UPI00221F538C|nr:CNH domain-containing protein [Halteromyces radiatus]KAI8082890.1 CNH domain-containing protein [Halteromyces radiatus]
MNFNINAQTVNSEHSSSEQLNESSPPSSPSVTTQLNTTSSHYALESTQLDYDGGPIPDSIRKSYVQQKLPVRKQSLAAFGQNRANRQRLPTRRIGSSLLYPPPDRLARSFTTTSSSSSTSSSPASPSLSSDIITNTTGYKTPTRSATVALSSSSPTISSGTTTIAAVHSNSPLLPTTTYDVHTTTTSSNLNLQSSLPTIHSTSKEFTSPLLSPLPETTTTHSSETNNTNDKRKEDDDDEDFYFGDRPPSTINCTRPILSSTSSNSSLYGTTPLKSLNTSLDTASTHTTKLKTGPETPIPINTYAPIKEDDDDSTVFSPVTPAVYDDNDNDTNGRPSDTWPTPTPSLSETIMAEERERTYWRKGSVGDIIQTVSSSLPENYQSSSFSNDQVQQQQLPVSLQQGRNDDDDPVTTLTMVTTGITMEQAKHIEQRKSIHAYYSTSLSTHTNPSLLSLQRNPSRSSSVSTSQLYPALLSRVAQELYKRLPVQTLFKDDIEYPHTFNGKEAVECLLQILRTNDRNLGILVGRALDHQHFFHDVTYEHHLRDSRDKIYQFRHHLDSSLGQTSNAVKTDEDSPIRTRDMDENDKKELPNGIFTLLTNCYSPTCARGQGCYSIHCPRKGKLVKRSISQSSLQEKEEKSNLWIHSVPKAIVDATSKEERKRQECIYELIYTEANFVKDLQYVHNYWVKPLITQDIIPDERREHFVQEVFWNMADVEKVNTVLSQALLALQKEQHVIQHVGDILLNHVSHFDPFVAYGAHQIIGKFKFELEKKRNPVFAQFVQNTERLPESKRLELNGYLTKPTTRLGKYNLLLREIWKRTPKENSDYETIPKVMDIITDYLLQVNTETGKCENIFNLQQIEERLSFKSSAEYVDLRLRDPQRQLIIQGRMKRKGNTSSEASDLQVFLFDHYLIFAKIKYHDHLEYYKVYRKPIPLELLTISTVVNNNRAKRASTLLSYSRSSVSHSNSHSSLPRASTSDNLLAMKSNTSSSITFYHHGRKGSPPITLFVSNISARKTWTEKILQQQQALSMEKSVFTVRYIVIRQFLTSNRVHDSIMITDQTKKEGQQQDNYTMLVGTDMGVYVRINNNDEEEDGQLSTMKRVIPLDRISQIEVMEDAQLLVLADKTLWTFPLDDILDTSDNKPLSIKKGRTISTNTAFFHVGECINKTMVCIAKPNTLATTTIRVLEPIATDESKKTKTGFSIRRLVRNGPVGLKPYKDLYLPSEASAISLLKSKMCISCPREIGVVDMKSFGVQALLDPEDEELDFVFSRQDIRPITIFRVQFAEYLVCYNEFGFFVDQRGRWIRSSHIMEWEGEPDAFALSYPYVLVFEPGFIEVRNIITGQVDQLIRGKNIRCTNTREGVLQGSMNDPDNDSYQVLFQLDRISSLDT